MSSAGWTGEGLTAAQEYRLMAEHGFGDNSPTYRALALAVADDLGLCARLDALPDGKRQPNLVFGALRLLGAPVTDPAAALRWTAAHWDEVEAVVRSHRTQTNEARRCATLLPTLAAIDGPLALIEVGASAGLCLLPDRYAYRYRTPDGVVEVGDSSLVLRCDVTGPAPLPTRLPDIVWRRGLDLHPLDAGSADDAAWLQALVWPEQTERFDILRRALDLARADPPQVVQGNLLTDLPALVDAAPPDATVVILHSAVLAYLGEADRAEFVRSLRGLGRDVVWVSNESPGIVVEGGPRRDGRFLLGLDGVPQAWTGQHGATLDWLPG